MLDWIHEVVLNCLERGGSYDDLPDWVEDEWHEVYYELLRDEGISTSSARCYLQGNYFHTHPEEWAQEVLMDWSENE